MSIRFIDAILVSLQVLHFVCKAALQDTTLIHFTADMTFEVTLLVVD